MMLDQTPKQGSFWDSQWIEHLIDRESFEWHFRRVIRPLIHDKDFAWAYDRDCGRKAIPPSLIVCSLILQQRYQLSDREMERQIRFNLATKYALCLPMDDEGFDHTVLCKFRKMLLENDQTKLCFEKFRQALIEAGFIKAGETAVIDTTHVIADIAIPNTIELIQMGIKAVLKSAEATLLGIGNPLVKNLDLGIVYEKCQRSDGKEFLVALVLGAKRLIDYLEKSGDAKHPQLKEFLDQLRRILHENTEEHLEGRGKKRGLIIEERSDFMPDRLVSTVDPDARHGRKNKETKFTGYKAQIVESEKEFIMDIDGMEGNHHDSWNVFPMMIYLKTVGIRPDKTIGDKAYSDEPLGMNLGKMGVQMITPMKKREHKYFPNDLFEYYSDENGDPKVRCPSGQEGSLFHSYPWGEKVFAFTNCGHCSLKPQCTIGENRTVAVTPSMLFRQRKAAFNKTNGYKALMKERSKIERKNGQLKTKLGLRRCRYRGLPKFKLQCFFAAAAANVQRLVSLFVHGPPEINMRVGLYA